MNPISIIDCIIISTTIFTSVLIIAVFILDKRLRHLPANKFLASYVGTNFLVSTAGLILSVFSSHSDYSKRPERFLVSSSFFVFAVVAYLLGLSVITLDRYLAIMHPLEYSVRMSRKRANRTVVGFWLCVALFGVVVALVATLARNEKGVVSTVMMLVMHVTAFAGFISLIFVNSIVLREVRRQTRILHSLTVEESGESRRVLRRREARTAYLCFAMVFSFLCSWLPNAVFAVIRFILNRMQEDKIYIRIGTTVFFSGLVVNLVLYILLKADFRSSLKALLLRVRCWKAGENRIGSAMSTSNAGFRQ